MRQTLYLVRMIKVDKVLHCFVPLFKWINYNVKTCHSDENSFLCVAKQDCANILNGEKKTDDNHL